MDCTGNSDSAHRCSTYRFSARFCTSTHAPKHARSRRHDCTNAHKSPDNSTNNCTNSHKSPDSGNNCTDDDTGDPRHKSPDSRNNGADGISNRSAGGYSRENI